MATFTFAPDFQSSAESSPQISKFVSGDGFEKRVQFGLHTNPSTWSLTFAKRTNAERDAIIAFLETQAGIQSFTWATPSGVLKTFVCAEWQTTLDNYGSNTIQAKFVEVFEP